ncbi:phage major capsid protein [Meridianimarinicoccus roseus]|jgi:HK97 family phage major capsid protein|uniref:Phage major capsid protein n=1 Tax=Meridianimarinicoccus roseus TaxID=2072018 RepID=A0A2V2LMT8_9RHOB|nr:phage major capsid protein [Meridianimarinicoccus roseus]PWR03053.1 phage major capsid protein [Meridianimarinicoccus roseus]
MTHPETKARAGGAVPAACSSPPACRAPADAALDIKSALAGLMDDLTAFRAGITTQLKAQEEKLTMLDRKTAFAGRPALSTATDIDLSHKQAFGGYLRNGDDDALRGLDLQHKGMSTAVDADGGYLVDPQTSAAIQTVLRSNASIRAISTVVNVESNSYDVLIDHSELGYTWTNETASLTETTAPQITRVPIPLHELSALPKASQRLLDDSAFDIETWLAGRIADKFARAEATAFISGDGIDKPRGILSHPQVPQDIWAWGSLGYVPSGQSGDFASTAPSDPIIELVYALDAQYRANASFVMNSKTAGAVRKMKDADGRFLWADGLASGEPARLMGYPVLIAEQMPDIAPDSIAIAFGDFAAGYTIAERPDLRVLRDPFSAKPHVLFYATKRVGGDVSDFAAIKLMKFAVN